MTPQRTVLKRSRLFYATQGLCLFALLYVLAVNFSGLPGQPLAPWAPERWKPLTTTFGLGQRWGMFEAVPSRDGWYVARATLKDGSEVDLLRHGAPVDWKRADCPARLYPNYYWQKLFREMTYFDEQGYQVFRAPVAEYLCRHWNSRNPPEKQVVKFEFSFCTQDKAPAANAATPSVMREQLVHLEFNPESERPAVGGYSDARKLH